MRCPTEGDHVCARAVPLAAPSKAGITIIRTPLVRLWLAVARAAGGDIDRLIERHRLPPTVESLPDVGVRSGVVYRLSDEVAALTGDPFFGLHLAGVMPRGQFGLLEFMLRSASTIREACRFAVRYMELVCDAAEVWFEERASEAIIDQRVHGEPACGGCHPNEFTIAMIVRLFREAFGGTWRPRRVWFAHPPRPDASPLVSFFETENIVFGADSNGFSFEISELDHPIPSSDQALLAVLDSQAKAIVAKLPAKGDPIARIRERIRQALPGGPPDLAELARSLSMSPRTLQRRLADHDTSFSDVIDDVRSALSKLYVSDSALELGEIAFLLGYSELRAFIRAFKRWTGVPPGSYRNQRSRVA